MIRTIAIGKRISPKNRTAVWKTKLLKLTTLTTADHLSKSQLVLPIRGLCLFLEVNNVIFIVGKKRK